MRLEARANNRSTQIKEDGNLTRTTLAFCLMAIAVPLLPAAAAEIPETKEDQALVVFYRPKSAGGAVIRFNINHGSEPIGGLPNGSVLFRHLDSGQHVFTCEGGISGDSLSLTVEVGEVHFVRGSIKMGLYAGRPTFTVVSEEKARKAIAKIK